MSYICASTDVSIVPLSCHCHVVVGEGTQSVRAPVPAPTLTRSTRRPRQRLPATWTASVRRPASTVAVALSVVQRRLVTGCESTRVSPSDTTTRGAHPVARTRTCTSACAGTRTRAVARPVSASARPPLADVSRMTCPAVAGTCRRSAWIGASASISVEMLRVTSGAFEPSVRVVFSVSLARLTPRLTLGLRVAVPSALAVAFALPTFCLPTVSVAVTFAPGTVVTVSAARLPTLTTGLAGAADGRPSTRSSGLGVLPLPMWLTTLRTSAAVVRRVARSGT